MYTTYHVAKSGSDIANGAQETPFRTISRATSVVRPGDTVIVHEGTYRESVQPIIGGATNKERITFAVADGEHAVIKGSEVVTDWELYKGTVWTATVSNSIFPTFNPFYEKLSGDWLAYPKEWNVHRGDVYLNGKSLYEAASLTDVLDSKIRDGAFKFPLRTAEEYIKYPEDSTYQWYAEVTDEETVIYANFQSYNPNDELVEISVRETCFYPIYPGIDYITVKGFEMAQAATPWAPPTSHQTGLLGPNWSKGWIIEDNIIHDAKCSAISLGKDFSSGHNNYTVLGNKPGFQYQWEAVCEGLRRGWSKEKVGSHIVRNNTIYDCGQNGIVGHMGASFCEIYNNHIYNIGVKHEYFGYELAGIKLHAPIDTQIHDNLIYDCTIGVWLDWQIQGTRFTHNVLFGNDLDIHFEVSHGPIIIDHNIFGSDFSLSNHAQGMAFVHNLFGGNTRVGKVLNRATPYHLPHSTQLLGCSLSYNGDEYYYNNIFIGNENKYHADGDSYGTSGYNACPDNYDDYKIALEQRSPKDLDDYVTAEQPVFINNNAYYQKATPYTKEKSFYESEAYNPNLQFMKETDGIYMELTLPEEHFHIDTERKSSYQFYKTRISNMLFETPSGEEIHFFTDLNNQELAEHPAVGPLESLQPGYNKIKLKAL